MLRHSFYKNRNLLLLALIAFGVVAGVWIPTVHAQGGTAISQGFQADANDSAIVSGALVSFKPGSADTVQSADTQTAANLVGVVNKVTLLALTNTNSQLQIVTVGDTPTLVSDINGSIQAGDKLTASPISGIGMKATANSEIIGIAQQSFDTRTAKSQTISDRNGKSHSIHIGEVVAQIDVSYYLVPTSTILPPFLQSLANNIAGKPVSVVRILIACILLLLASAGIFILLYTSIHSGIISIGRNPLAAQAINKGLATVGVTTVLILAFTLVITYVVLAL